MIVVAIEGHGLPGVGTRTVGGHIWNSCLDVGVYNAHNAGDKQQRDIVPSRASTVLLKNIGIIFLLRDADTRLLSCSKHTTNISYHSHQQVTKLRGSLLGVFSENLTYSTHCFGGDMVWGQKCVMGFFSIVLENCLLLHKAIKWERELKKPRDSSSWC